MPTKIEWTDESWQVTHGCTVVSPGCTSCYAMRMAARLERMGAPQYAGLTQPSKAGPVWNGTVREADIGTVPQPLRWKKPRRIFVNSMSDLFHKDVSARHIAHVFGIMACAQRHTFQVLTKRPDRMAELLASAQFGNDVIGYASKYAHLANGVGHFTSEEWVEHNQRRPRLSAMRPLPNVWLGTSVEDQPRADERIPHLLRTPAAVRFLSCEPLLSGIDIRLPDDDECYCDLESRAELGIPAPTVASTHTALCPHHCRVDLVICGGESGPGARPMHPDWARSLRDQCAAADVPFFFKQWGEWEEFFDRDRDDPDWGHCPPCDRHGERYLNLAGGHGFHGERVVAVRRVGKKAAGALLDGREWRQFPVARATPNASVTTSPQGPKHT